MNRRNKIAKINSKCLKPTQLGTQITFLWQAYNKKRSQDKNVGYANCVDSFSAKRTSIQPPFEQGFVVCCWLAQ